MQYKVYANKERALKIYEAYSLNVWFPLTLFGFQGLFKEVIAVKDSAFFPEGYPDLPPGARKFPLYLCSKHGNNFFP